MTAFRSAAWAVTLRNDLSELERLAALIDDWVGQHQLNPDIAFHLNLVLDELLTNTISYGYPDNGIREITVALALVDEVIEVTVSDDGMPFDPFTDAPDPDLDSDLEDRPIGGLGVHFTRTFMDEASYQRVDDRNVVTLRKSTAPDNVYLDLPED